MMTESTIVRKFSKERHSETKTQYTAHGENSVLVASIDDEKTIESFAAYSAKNGELIASAASLLGMTLSVKAEAAEVTEGILSGEFQSLIIYTDDPKAAIVLACILMQKHLDYLISPESSEAMPDLSPAFEETVTDREKGRILVGYLAAFEKDASLVVTADKLDKAISSLFLSGKSRCILILPLLSDEYIPDFPKLVIRKGKSIISKGNNDTFKRLFLYTLDSFRIQPEKFIYAYLLNAIDSSDTLGTVRRITEHFRYTVMWMKNMELQSCIMRYAQGMDASQDASQAEALHTKTVRMILQISSDILSPLASIMAKAVAMILQVWGVSLLIHISSGICSE